MKLYSILIKWNYHFNSTIIDNFGNNNAKSNLEFSYR